MVVTNQGTVYWIPAIKMHVDCSKEGFVPTQPASPTAERDCHVKLGSWVMDARDKHSSTFYLNNLSAIIIVLSKCYPRAILQVSSIIVLS